ncbi:MAG TPA: MraY family glycosyltransferase, partial [Actinomycetes bacterium]|nr:MraY family glycosyltransferase [Actinomycetes bacterium]
NAINFIDGLDGLAAGIIGIGALAFFAFSYFITVDNGYDRATTAALVTVVLAGMCAGFLPHNFNPARIFMGDSGSMVAGLLLSASVITLAGKLDPAAVGDLTLLPALMPLILPFAILAVPLVDLLLAVVRRTRARRSPFAPDKQHLHHRLLEIGHSQKQAVLVMYLWAAALAIGSILVVFEGTKTGIIVALGIAALAALATRKPRKVSR